MKQKHTHSWMWYGSTGTTKDVFSRIVEEVHFFSCVDCNKAKSVEAGWWTYNEYFPDLTVLERRLKRRKWEYVLLPLLGGQRGLK